MALYIPDINLLFVHIPKTAGISIRHALMAGNKFGFGISGIEIGSVHNGILDVAQERGVDFANKTNTSFGVVRNPYDWAVSYYEFSKTFFVHPDHPIIKDMNFNTFVSFVCQSVEEKRITSIGRYMTQTDYLFDSNGKKIVNVILRFEQLKDDWNIICLIAKADVSLRHLNESTIRKDYESYYDDRTISMINKTFYNDFINFNYKFL